MDGVHRQHRDGNGRAAVAVVLLAGLIVAGTVASTAASGAVGAAPTATATPNGDAPDDRTEARGITVGETVSANVSSSEDVDWYAVNATAGDAILPRLVLQNTTGGRGLIVSLYDASGVQIDERKADQMSGPAAVAGRGPQGQQDARAVAPDVAEYTGTYYVAVRENRWNNTTGNVTSPYNLTVETRPLDGNDPNENASTATPLAVGGSVRGNVTAYDHDVFAVNLTAGRNYTVTLTHAENESSDRYLKEVRLFSDAANVTDATTPRSPGGPIIIGRGGDGTGNFTADRDGIHYLRIGQSAITANLTNLDDYRLTITVENGSSADGGPVGSDGDTPRANATTSNGTGTGTATGSPTANATAVTESPTGTDGAVDDDPGSATIVSSATPTPTSSATSASGSSATATATPTDSAGPGFGAAAASVALLAAALLARRRGQ